MENAEQTFRTLLGDKVVDYIKTNNKVDFAEPKPNNQEPSYKIKFIQKDFVYSVIHYTDKKGYWMNYEDDKGFVFPTFGELQKHYRSQKDERQTWGEPDVDFCAIN